jgi:hypothetical protein
VISQALEPSSKTLRFINAGRMLAWAGGGPHADVLAWWGGMHHDIYMGGMHM